LQIKGRTFRATFDFISQKFSLEKIQSFFRDYPQFFHAQDFSEIDWYPLELFIELSEKIDKHFGFGDAALLDDIGAHSARVALDSSHKLFKSLSPRALISNMQSLLSSYYSRGIAEHEFTAEKRAKLSIKDFCSSPLLCRKIQGWLKQALKLAGAKDVKISNIQLKTADMCFSIEWN
jgi:uncharacterized protein (TIGR02265 family)